MIPPHSSNHDVFLVWMDLPDIDLEGRVIIMTGADRGLGRATSLGLAKKRRIGREQVCCPLGQQHCVFLNGQFASSQFSGSTTRSNRRCRRRSSKSSLSRVQTKAPIWSAHMAINASLNRAESLER